MGVFDGSAVIMTVGVSLGGSARVGEGTVRVKSGVWVGGSKVGVESDV
jgi:hypothetical protein